MYEAWKIALAGTTGSTLEHFGSLVSVASSSSLEEEEPTAPEGSRLAERARTIGPGTAASLKTIAACQPSSSERSEAGTQASAPQHTSASRNVHSVAQQWPPSEGLPSKQSKEVQADQRDASTSFEISEVVPLWAERPAATGASFSALIGTTDGGWTGGSKASQNLTQHTQTTYTTALQQIGASMPLHAQQQDASVGRASGQIIGVLPLSAAQLTAPSSRSALMDPALRRPARNLNGVPSLLSGSN